MLLVNFHMRKVSGRGFLLRKKYSNVSVCETDMKENQKKYFLYEWFHSPFGGGRVVRWCWVNFQCQGVLQLDYSRARAYCTCSRCGWGCLDIFTLIYPFSSLSPYLWETARYRLKYCLKGPLNPKQPTNQKSQPFQNYLHFLSQQVNKGRQKSREIN